MPLQRLHWLAGVVGLELRNPLGSKSARFAGGFPVDLAETLHQRPFASKLRRGQRAAAARISAGLGRTEFDAADKSSAK
jgi:hypothetical protein